MNSFCCRKCVNTLFELALNDPEFCSKLITICTLSVDQLRMFRGYFVQCMQHNFEQLINEDKLETNNIVKFRKFVRLLGEYCIKSHLQLIPIIKGFIICLKVLVKSADLTDIKLFTNQVNKFSKFTDKCLNDCVLDYVNWSNSCTRETRTAIH